jgi:arginine exporter protein ArgO
MKQRTRHIAMAGVAALLIGGGMAAGVRQSAAHHSMAMYDQQRTVTVIGRVVEFRWNNPHVYVLVNGTIGMDDDPTEWWLETGAPSSLIRFGWSATSLRPGDLVSIVVNPHRDSSQKVALILSVTLIDTGQELNTGAALFSP